MILERGKNYRFTCMNNLGTYKFEAIYLETKVELEENVRIRGRMPMTVKVVHRGFAKVDKQETLVSEICEVEEIEVV